MKKVLISVPSMGWIHKTVAAKLLEITHIGKQKLEVTVSMPTEVPVENNYHHIIKEFLAGDFDFWLNMDADNPPSKDPLDLVDLDLDIVSCPTPMFKWDGTPGIRPIYWNAYRLNKQGFYTEHVAEGGLHEVDAVGAGCILINKRVFKAPFMQQGPFTRVLWEDGTVKYGTDIAFSQRAKKCGFKIHAHFDYLCQHFKECELNEMAAAFLLKGDDVESEAEKLQD